VRGAQGTAVSDQVPLTVLSPLSAACVCAPLPLISMPPAPTRVEAVSSVTIRSSSLAMLVSVPVVTLPSLSTQRQSALSVMKSARLLIARPAVMRLLNVLPFGV
jgi:hypothetical protein